MSVLLGYTALAWALVGAFFFVRFWARSQGRKRAYRITGHIGGMACTPIVMVLQQFGWVRANFAVAYISVLALQATLLLFEIWDAHLRKR